MNLEAALDGEERSQQANRPGTVHKCRLGIPRDGSTADSLRVIPRLGHHARRLEQHTQCSERRIDAHGEARLDANPFRPVSVTLLDAAFGVASVAAHVPFPCGTVRAWLRIRASDDADDEIAG